MIEFYGIQVRATPVFKYLGVTFNAVGTAADHIKARTHAFKRASIAFFAGLQRLPAYTYDFLTYLWGALVIPVMTYGMDLFTWCPTEIKPLLKHQMASWRRLLRVGGRAPGDIVQTLLDLDCCTNRWRAQRTALFVRLLNSPPDSLQHVALSTFRELRTPWFEEVLADLRMIFLRQR